MTAFYCRRYLALPVLAIFAGLLFSSVPISGTQAQAPKNVSSGQPFSGGFVRYAGPDGSACREATPAEARMLSERPTGLKLHTLIPNRWDPRQTTGLKIILRGTSQLETFPAAKAAFLNAAAKWEARIATPLTVIINVDFGPTRFGNPFPQQVIGSTSTQDTDFPYAEVRQRLLETASSPGETMLYSSLPSAAVPTDLGATSTVTAPAMVFRALGLLPATADPENEGQLPAPPAIGFNSNFAFDFDPGDGIEGNQTDFDAVAVHEIGHALGFVSAVGFRDLEPTSGVFLSIWDLFRFRPGIQLGGFQSTPRPLSSGGEHRFFAGAAELALSTGNPAGLGGDGRQASHWKADELSGIFLGIMDPTISRGVREEITPNDLRALDIFGYRLREGFSTGDTIPPTISDVQPGGGETFRPGGLMEISWKSSDNLSIVSQQIDFSRDGGTSFSTSVATGLAGSVQTFGWTIPLRTETTTGRIRVTAQDGSFNQGTGTSTGNFTIRLAGPAAPRGLTAQASGKAVSLSWQNPEPSGAAVTGFNVYRSLTSPVTVVPANFTGQVNASTTSFTDPAVNVGIPYFYVVTATYADRTESDGSNEVTARIDPDTGAPTVQVTAPNSSTKKIKPGTGFTVSWTSRDNVAVTTHRISLSNDGGRTFPIPLAAGIGGSAQSFAVTFPAGKIKQAQVKVVAADAAGNEGEGVSTIFKVK